MGASPRTLPMMIRETERNEAEAMPLRQTSSGRGWVTGPFYWASVQLVQGLVDRRQRCRSAETRTWWDAGVSGFDDRQRASTACRWAIRLRVKYPEDGIEVLMVCGFGREERKEEPGESGAEVFLSFVPLRLCYNCSFLFLLIPNWVLLHSLRTREGAFLIRKLAVVKAKLASIGIRVISFIELAFSSDMFTTLRRAGTLHILKDRGSKL